jgi:hypothetical protein
MKRVLLLALAAAACVPAVIAGAALAGGGHHRPPVHARPASHGRHHGRHGRGTQKNGYVLHTSCPTSPAGPTTPTRTS